MTEKENLIEILDRNFGYTEEERSEIAETTDQHKHLPVPTIPGPRDY